MPIAATLKHLSLAMLPPRLLQPLRRIHYSHKLARGGKEPEMSVIPHLVGEGGCALDLGANFGLYTEFLARLVGPQGAVHAVEPIPATYDVLRYNITYRGLKQVTLYQAAISDQEQTVSMSIPRYREGGENLYEARIASGTDARSGSIRVNATTLDRLFGSLGQIDFVKCDIEGHEWNALRGAEGILKVHRPAWMIELSGNPDKADSSAAQVVKLMESAGYRMFYLSGTRIDRTSNCFFLRPEHVRRLAVQVESAA